MRWLRLGLGCVEHAPASVAILVGFADFGWTESPSAPMLHYGRLSRPVNLGGGLANLSVNGSRQR